jgi:hypothetical protein
VDLLDDSDRRLAELAAHALVQIGPRGVDVLEPRRDEPAVGTALALAQLKAGAL